MTKPTARAVPGIPLAALDAIKDSSTRDVLRALVDGHHVRNGDAGNGENRFVTAKELQTEAGRLNATIGQVVSQIPAPQKFPDVAQIVADAQAEVLNSALFRDLGERVKLIDAPRGLLATLKDEIFTGANSVLTELKGAVAGLPDGVTDITKIFEGTIKVIKGMRSTLYDPTGALPLAQAGIVAINDVKTTSTSAAARTLAGLSATINDKDTGLAAANADIGEINNVSVTSKSASAKKLAGLSAQVNDKDTGLPAANAAIGEINDVSATSKSAIAKKVAGITAQLTIDPKTKKPYAESAITEEATARVTKDLAIAEAIKTVWAELGGNSGLIQTGSDVTVNTAGAKANDYRQVQAALKDSEGNIISSAAIKQTTDALVTKSGQIEAKWIVNIDSGGAATGFRQAGFGISGSATENGVKYAFGVRADSFWVASANQSPINEGDTIPTAQVPFIVKTTEWTDSQGVTQPAGVYLNELFATSAKIGFAQIKTAHIGDAQITTAQIGDAQVDTLRLKGNAVTVPKVVSREDAIYSRGYNANDWVTIMETTVTLDFAGTIMAIATVSQASRDGGEKWNMMLYINGKSVAQAGGARMLDAVALSGALTVAAGTHTIQVKRISDVENWAINRNLTIFGVMR